MLTFARGGRFVAGSGACVFSFCLLSSLSLSQTAVVTPEPADSSESNPLLRQIQEQHQAVLKAIGEIQHNAEVSLDVHRDGLLTQIDALKRDFVSRRDQELGVMRRLHDDTRTVTLVTGGVAILVLLLNAVILFWGVHGIATRLNAIFSVPPLASVKTDIIRGIDEPLALDNSAAQMRLVEIIERLDKRLLELEAKTIQKASYAAVDAKPKISSVQGGQLASSFSRAPRVSITLGEGSAIGFLPPAVGAMKLHAWWSRVQKWKRMVRRPRSL